MQTLRGLRLRSAALVVSSAAVVGGAGASAAVVLSSNPVLSTMSLPISVPHHDSSSEGAGPIPATMPQSSALVTPEQSTFAGPKTLRPAVAPAAANASAAPAAVRGSTPTPAVGGQARSSTSQSSNASSGPAPATGAPASGHSSTSTAMSAPSSAAYGHESTEVFTVTVTGTPGDVAPTGTVQVVENGTVLCTATLSSTGSGSQAQGSRTQGYQAQGTCSLTDTELAVGNYNVSAHYGGDATYPASASALQALDISAP
ncbi:MAG: Ig-like domain-containing protein [Acidimicrobiales bacterium]